MTKTKTHGLGTSVQQALERGACVQPVESRGSSERPPFQADEDDTSARDVPDANPSGGDTDENAGGGSRRSCRLEGAISPQSIP